MDGAGKLAPVIMPTYEYMCQCGQLFERFRPMAECGLPAGCPDCGRDSARIYLRAPHLAGMSDGPSSCNNEMVFNRPDVAKETRMTLSAMEDAGRLRDPAKMRGAVALNDWSQNTDHGPNLDYDKGDHPLD